MKFETDHSQDIVIARYEESQLIDNSGLGGDGRTIVWEKVVVETVVSTIGVAPPPVPHTLTGNIRIHKNFHSKFLPNDRDVIVYLPPDYEADRKKRYPVLYLQDGQNLFDGATSFIPGVEWGVDETAEALITSHVIEPLIIVGIYNTGDHRKNEYTPTKDPYLNSGGEADLYGRLLVEELKPCIDAQYRTLKSPINTGLGGSSLGGLVSLYLGLKYPKVYGKLAIMSPSVWWGENVILQFVQELKSKPKQRIWLDMGTKEGGNAIEGARLLRDALVARGWVLNNDLKYFEAEGAGHSERAWAQRVGPMLKFLFHNSE